MKGRSGQVGVLALLVGCTYVNPKFQLDTESGGTDTGATTEVSASDSGGTVGGSGSDSIDDASADSGNTALERPELCDADLYAVSEQGALYLIDVDEEMAFDVLTVPDSGAVATDPMGRIMISPELMPGQIVIVDPVTLTPLDAIDVPGTGHPSFGRAAFGMLGRLWLGAGQGGGTISFTPGMTNLLAWDIPGLGNGGDMTMVGEFSALVITNDRTATHVSFEPQVTLTSPQLVGIPQTEIVTGLALDREGELWASSATGILFLLDLDLLAVDEPISVIGYADVGVVINDLAPIKTLPMGCEG